MIKREGLRREDLPDLIPLGLSDLPSCQSTSTARSSQQRGVSQCAESKAWCHGVRGAKSRQQERVQGDSGRKPGGSTSSRDLDSSHLQQTAQRDIQSHRRR